MSANTYCSRPQNYALFVLKYLRDFPSHFS
ncbi:hypothetical protein LEMLEM_LOCUS23853 [Lemmus lemmus]